MYRTHCNHGKSYTRVNLFILLLYQMPQQHREFSNVVIKKTFAIHPIFMGHTSFKDRFIFKVLEMK